MATLRNIAISVLRLAGHTKNSHRIATPRPQQSRPIDLLLTA